MTQNSVLEAAPERQRPGAVQNESQSPGVAPLGELKKLVAAVQSTDFLSQRLMKEVQGVVNACAHYSLSPEGILLWKEKLMFHSREVGSMNY